MALPRTQPFVPTHTPNSIARRPRTDPTAQETLRAAEEAVTRLIEACRKPGPLYQRDPRAVAQVSRTGKWHLNAIATLGKVLSAPGGEPGNKVGKRGA
jgi:hypothetical protein